MPNKSYLVAYSVKYGDDPAKYPARDDFQIFEGNDAYEEALVFYKEITRTSACWTANIAEIVLSTEAYEGVEFNEKDNT